MGKHTKYFLYKRVRRIKGSSDEWEDVVPSVFSIDGDGTKPYAVAEENSVDCGWTEDLLPKSEWREEEGEYVCDECETLPIGKTFVKYIESENEYICKNTNKYKKLVKHTSNNGTDWMASDTIVLGDLIEANSEDCGYVTRTRESVFCEDVLPFNTNIV